jgi:hypothetical protein
LTTYLFLHIKTVNNEQDSQPEIEFKLTDFYTSSFLRPIMSGFDLSQKCGVLERNTRRSMSFGEFFISEWNQVKIYANALLQMPTVQNDINLAYQIDYLLTENSLVISFDLLQTTIFTVGFEYFLLLNQTASSDECFQEDTISNIIQLHKIASKYYDILKKDKRFRNIVYRPYFYS